MPSTRLASHVGSHLPQRAQRGVRQENKAGAMLQVLSHRAQLQVGAQNQDVCKQQLITVGSCEDHHGPALPHARSLHGCSTCQPHLWHRHAAAVGQHIRRVALQTIRAGSRQY